VATTTTTTAPPVTGVAGVDPAKRPGFLAAVAQVKRLAGSDDRIVRAGREICAEIAAGMDRPAVAANAAYQFSSDSVAVTPAEAEQLVAATEATLC